MREAITWIRGHLRRFESMSSMGAWFCYFNTVGSKEFGQFLAQYCTTYSNTQVGTVDKLGFDRVALSRALSEPSQLVDSMSCSDLFILPPHSDLEFYEYLTPELESLAWSVPLSIDFKELRCCPLCMANRFHSMLHQINIIDECVFHSGTRLVTHETPWGLQPRLNRFVGLDSRFAASLCEQWFKKSDPKLDWSALRPDDLSEIKSASKTISGLSQALLELRSKANSGVHGESPRARVVSPSAEMALRDTLVAFHIPLPKLPDSKGWGVTTPPTELKIKSSPEVAAAILAILPGQLPNLQWLRSAYCNIQGLDPPWRLRRRMVAEMHMKNPSNARLPTKQADLRRRLLFRKCADWLDFELVHSVTQYSIVSDFARNSVSALIQAIAILKWKGDWVYESTYLSRSGHEDVDYLISSLSAFSSERMFAPVSTCAAAINLSREWFPWYAGGWSTSYRGHTIEHAPKSVFVLNAPMGALAEFLDTLLLEDALFMERLVRSGKRLRFDGGTGSKGSVETDYSNVFELLRRCRSTMVLRRETDGVCVSFFRHTDEDSREGTLPSLNRPGKTVRRVRGQPEARLGLEPVPLNGS